MSSGPAISRTKRSIASEGRDPSSATSTRLPSNMAELPGRGARAERHVERRTARADQENGRRRRAQHALGHAAEHETAETIAAVARHHDEVGAAVARGLDD